MGDSPRQVRHPSADGEDALVGAYSAFGKTSRMPMLWVYAANDSFFRPDLARRMVDALHGRRRQMQLIDAPAFGSDGHFLFSSGGLRSGPGLSTISCASGTWDCANRSRHRRFRRCRHHRGSASKAVPRSRTISPRVRTRPSPCHPRGLLVTGARSIAARMRDSARARAARYIGSGCALDAIETKGPTSPAELPSIESVAPRPAAPASRPRDRRVRRSP